MLASVVLMPAMVLGPVELRGGTIVDAPVEQVSAIGVRVGGDEPRVIGWDHVRRVTGEHAARAGDFAEVSDQVWRARTRLARGDIEIASPLFEALHERYAELGGPTGLVIAEGVVRCRLWRGDQAGALMPWLHALELRRAGVAHAGESARGAMISLADEATGLVPALPPIWMDTPEVRAIARSAPLQSGDPVVDALHEVYAQAAAARTGIERGEMPVWSNEVRFHAGVALAHDMVRARGDDQRGADARDRLEQGLEAELSTWREAWRRAALGQALADRAGEEERMRGVMMLLHLPARFAMTQPYLAGVCEAQAAQALRGLGREGAADRLIAALRAREPLHPVLGDGGAGGDDLSAPADVPAATTPPTREEDQP